MSGQIGVFEEGTLFSFPTKKNCNDSGDDDSGDNDDNSHIIN